MGDNGRQGNLGYFSWDAARARPDKAATFDPTARIDSLPLSTVTASPPTLPVSMSSTCMSG